MTDTEIERIGHNASLVLENEAYTMAMASMKEQVVQRWKECPIRDAEGQLLLLQLAKLADMFEGILAGFVQGGKLAASKLELDSLRNESGARKLMRRVL